MALAVRAAQTERSRADQVVWLLLTMVFGSTFLGIKAIEYTDKFDAPPRARPALPLGRALSEAGASMFYSLYFAMTGLHALHMIIGIGIMTVIARDGLAAARSTPSTTRRSKSRASTGTSSTSSGSSCSRCCT